MNESVAFGPALMRNSLIFTGDTLRIFCTADSLCVLPFTFHEALPTRSPLSAAEPDVIRKVALALAPGAIASPNDFTATAPPDTTEFQPVGAETLSSSPVIAAPVVFRNVTVVSCEEPGENVWSPGGMLTAAAGAMLSRGTSYLAATMLA